MAHVDYFLKIEGIDGESLQKGHEKEIEILSFSWGANNAGSFAGNLGGGSGKVAVADFKFTVPVNKATPKLFLACMTGEHIKSAQLTCRKAGKTQQDYLKWKFTDLLISSYHIGGSIGADHLDHSREHATPSGQIRGQSQSDLLPVDEVTFNFTKIEVVYAPQKADGSLDAGMPAGYDLKAGEKV